MPSMVVIFLFSASFTCTWQDLSALPSIWTVQAPHWATPQPYFVPVSPSCSLMTHSSGTSGPVSTSYLFPFTSSEIMEHLQYHGWIKYCRFALRKLFGKILYQGELLVNNSVPRVMS